MQADKVKKDLEEIRIHNVYAMLSCFALNENEVWNQVKDSKINSDNRPYLEFFKSDEIDLPASLFPQNAARPIMTNIDSTDHKILNKYFKASDHLLQVRLFNLDKQDKLTYEECLKTLDLIPNDELAKHITKECRIQLAYRYLIEGMHYHKARNYDMTIRRYEDAQSLTPEWSELLLRLGIAYNEIGRYDDAITTLKKEVEIDSASSSANSNLAVAFINNRMDDKAISNLKKAISLDSNYPEAHYRLGLLYLTVGKLNQGKLELETTLKIRPGFEPAMEALKALNNADKIIH